jgi:hypothetical protein
VRECGEYWRRRGIAPREIRELAAELEDHMSEAAKVGKSFEQSIRSAREWAEDQAEDLAPHTSVSEHLRVWLVSVLTIFSIVLLSLHLTRSNLIVEVHAEILMFAVILAVVVRVSSSTVFPFVIFNPFKRKGIFDYGDYLSVATGLSLGVMLSVVQRTTVDFLPTIELSLSHSLTIVGIAVALRLTPSARKLLLRIRTASRVRIRRLRCLDSSRSGGGNTIALLKTALNKDRTLLRLIVASNLLIAFGWMLSLPDPLGITNLLLASATWLSLSSIYNAVSSHRPLT